MVQLPRPTLDCGWFTSNYKRKRPVLEQITVSVVQITPNLLWWQTLPFRLVLTCPSFTKTPHVDLNFQKEEVIHRRVPPERPKISIVHCSLPACDLCWSFGDIVFINDSKLNPLKYLPCIMEIATWFYIPNLWLLHRLHRQYSYRKSCKVKEKHSCFYITLFHTPSAPYSTLWDQRRERCWILYQLLSALWALE